MDPLLQRALEIANRPRSPDRTDIAMDDPIIERAHPYARLVYFERGDGRIYGPARVTDLAKIGRGAYEWFWVLVEYRGQVGWVRSDRLRSKQDSIARNSQGSVKGQGLGKGDKG